MSGKSADSSSYLPRGALLLGGASSRMGRPKALLELGGTSLGQRAAAALSPWVSSIAFVGSHRFDTEPWSAALGLAGVSASDRPGVAGPLGGLLALFDLDPDSWWAVAACDLPRVEPAAIGWLLAQRQPDASAILPRALGRIQPLLALYGPASRALLEALATSEHPAPRHLAGQPGVVSPQVPAALQAQWTNVNTPADWRPFEA